MSQPVRTMLERLPRPWRRRRPVVIPPVANPADLAELGYGRRCAQLDPTGTEVSAVLRTYQDTHPGRVFRGMQAIPTGQHRVRPVVEFVGDDYPTTPIRAVTAEPSAAAQTVEFPRALLTLLAPVGAR